MARKMRDSGVEWIGEVPEGWEVNLIGTFYSQRSEKVSDRDYAPLSVTMKGVLSQLATVAKTDDGDNRKLVKKGDFAINSRSDRRGSCGISEYDGSVSLINTILMPRGEMDPRYYNWLFHTEAFADEFYKWGHGIVDDLWTTRWSEMKRIQIVAPPLPEQRRIADYLDEKCAAIDGAVDELKRGIEDCKAWKKAIIFEAVTGKANVLAAKNAKVAKRQMRDSGIPWIGEIPEGWEVRKAKSTLLANDGGVWGEDPYGENDTIVLRSTEQSLDGKLCINNPAYRHLSDTERNRFLLKRCDLIITKSSGSRDHIGKTSLIDESVGNLKCCYSNFIQRIRVAGSPKYYWYLYNNYIVKSQFDYLCTTTTGLNNLNAGIIGNVVIPIPPLPEQQAIADYLDEKCAAIDALVAEKEKLITDLEAYKKSLIFELVTGKREVA